MCKCRSHGTFPLFGLQSSHLNICYYHQDLHRRPLRPGSRPGFCSDRRALLLIGAWRLPRRPGIGRALQRHPFSGLVDSAGELFTHSLADFDFHDHRPAVLIDQHPLWVLGRGRCAPDASNHWLYPIELAPSSSYPEGNFGGNQLLDGSISLSPLYPSQTNDLHACSHSNPSQKIKVGRRCNPRGDPASQLPCALRVYSPVDSHTCQTPWSVFSRRDEWGAHRPMPGARIVPGHAVTARAAVHDRDDGVSTGVSKARALAATRDPHRSTPRADRRTGRNRSTSDRGASPAPIHFPPDNFKHSLTLFSKSFSSFPRGTCLLSVSRPVQPRRGSHLSGAPFQGTWAWSAAEDASPDYNSDAAGARFSSWAFPGSLAVTRGILEIPGATGARTTVSEGLSTTARRGDRRRGLDFGPTASGSARETSIRPRPREPRGEGATMRDTQADVPSTRRPRAQLAFKDSMVHGILQFTPSIAFRYVLHRCESRDIRCRESFRLSPEEGAPPTPRLRGRAPSTQFPWRFSRRGSFASRAGRRRVPPRLA
uniref:Uncharacterized protein n=1 Tax=Populus alba TaxID=43335 RepID=A0A4V6XX95_POPAL|nr:hypothetical protein D5086_0000012900 [Populus alba]